MDRPVMTEAERAWHKTRQMLVQYNNKLHVAQLGDDRGHREWFIDEGFEDAYENSVRGFIDETGVYLYKGPDYRIDTDVEYLAHLISTQNLPVETNLVLPKGTKIYGGMTPGELGVRWQPLMVLESVK